MKSLNKYVNDVIVSICTNRKHHHDYRITISGFFILYWKLEAWFIMQRTVTILTLSSLKLEWELPSCSLFSQSLSFYSKSPPFSHCFIIQICKWRSVNESCIFTEDKKRFIASRVATKQTFYYLTCWTQKVRFQKHGQKMREEFRFWFLFFSLQSILWAYFMPEEKSIRYLVMHALRHLCKA